MNFHAREHAAELTPTRKIRRCRHGAFLFMPHDFYLGGALDRYGEYSELEVEFLCQLITDQDTVIEVGSNIGTITVPLAKKARKVYAFEAQRIIFQMLCANVTLNDLRNVHAYNVALGDHQDTIITPKVDYDNVGNFGGVSLIRNGEGEDVPMRRLDGFMLAPRLLKIDVEGMEVDVLHGASDTIAAWRPFIYVENDRPQHSAELIQTLFDFEYNVWWHLTPLYNPANFYANAENAYPNVASVNMFCAPQEKLIGVRLPKVKSADDVPAVMLPVAS